MSRFSSGSGSVGFVEISDLDILEDLCSPGSVSNGLAVGVAGNPLVVFLKKYGFGYYEGHHLVRKDGGIYMCLLCCSFPAFQN